MPNPWDAGFDFTQVTNVVRSIPQHIPRQDMKRERIDNLDVARGIAIALMMLSHTVMALNKYDMLPDYAIVPIHLVTKFSSSLFILIFGLSISIFYLPYYKTSKWPQKRNRLLWRSVNLLIWYKILIIVQMFQTYPKEEIMKALFFKQFTDFTEVLNFYWLAILWIVLLIPLWAKMKWPFKFLTIALLATIGTLLNKHFDFWGIWQLKAMIVEYKGTYCYGQFQRGALALFGMLMGSAFLIESDFAKDKYKLGFASLGLSITMWLFFYYLTMDKPGLMKETINAIAHNVGKHPPSLEFMSLSLGGAFGILGICLLLPSKLIFLFKPFDLIGKEPFLCFNFHIFLIFVGFRYLLNLRWNVTYTETLLLYAVVIITSALVSPINSNIKRKGVLFKWLLP